MSVAAAASQLNKAYGDFLTITPRRRPKGDLIRMEQFQQSAAAAKQGECRQMTFTLFDFSMNQLEIDINLIAII